jgi:hypothetical protein
MLLGLGPDGPIVGRRVAVTGIGSVTCCGVGADALWEGLVHPDRIDTTEVRDFDPSMPATSGRTPSAQG